MRKKKRIYADTSIIGGCYDAEFRESSNKLIDYVRNGNAILVVSDLTLFELQGAPVNVLSVLQDVPSQDREDVELTPEARDLADLYVADGVVAESMLVDAQHIAVATVNRVDVLVSWNFKHVVNLDRIQGFNAVNLREGYALIEIRTPEEVLPYEEQNDEKGQRL